MKSLSKNVDDLQYVYFILHINHALMYCTNNSFDIITITETRIIKQAKTLQNILNYLNLPVHLISHRNISGKVLAYLKELSLHVPFYC